MMPVVVFTCKNSLFIVAGRFIVRTSSRVANVGSVFRTMRLSPFFSMVMVECSRSMLFHEPINLFSAWLQPDINVNDTIKVPNVRFTIFPLVKQFQQPIARPVQLPSYAHCLIDQW